jgi:hypothetical protein
MCWAAERLAQAGAAVHGGTSHCQPSQKEALLVDVAHVVLVKGEVDVSPQRGVGGSQGWGFFDRNPPPPRAHQRRAAEDVGVSGPVEDVVQDVPRQRLPVPRRLSFHLCPMRSCLRSRRMEQKRLAGWQL